ncbi:MAG: sodium-dependent transporter [Eubacteriales bacterium]|jgi:NSS family neurotransmitter:Na+ symporter|nr:sodium-dependent transporter [Eubacteriales bacterium]MDD4104234.1 sodium-dependent transporter [Eubacteriales bacterium]MDD4709939.1 sodium-dependent transporter [Eubacteriales bacterium]NLO16558.1 sodium-dependent transporter [Clostridiales bacterium]
MSGKSPKIQPELTGKRDQFKTRLGFVLAAVGSTLGMGDIWLFPYRVGQFGGAAFLIPYFIFVAFIGYIGIVEETSFGRGTRSGPIGAFSHAMVQAKKNPAVGKALGFIPTIGSFGIATGYTIVVGWILRYTWVSITGALMTNPSGPFFGAITGSMGSLPWHAIAMVITAFILIKGVARGIEVVNKFMVPLIYVLFIIFGIRIFTVPGSLEGLKFMVKPDFSKLGEIRTWVFALGQAFFSLSLGGSGTIIYGSYLADKENVRKSAREISVLDTLASVMVAFLIIPAAFAYGKDPAAGPPLLFITMTEVLQSMPGGRIFSVLFFVAVAFAGLTSLINLFETPIAAAHQHTKLSRTSSVLAVCAAAFVIGLPFENADMMGQLMDIVSIYINPLGAVIAAVIFFWVCNKKWVLDEVSKGSPKPAGEGFHNYGKYIFCGVSVLIYLINLYFVLVLKQGSIG